MNEEKLKSLGDMHEEFANLIEKYNDKLEIHEMITNTFLSFVGGLRSAGKEDLTVSLTELLIETIRVVYEKQEQFNDAT